MTHIKLSGEAVDMVVKTDYLFLAMMAKDVSVREIAAMFAETLVNNKILAVYKTSTGTKNARYSMFLAISIIKALLTAERCVMKNPSFERSLAKDQAQLSKWKKKARLLNGVTEELSYLNEESTNSLLAHIMNSVVNMSDPQLQGAVERMPTQVLFNALAGEVESQVQPITEDA
jgi:hypothetical protein